MGNVAPVLRTRVYVDWDYQGDGSINFAQPQDEITQYVARTKIRAGGQSGSNTARIGTCVLTLINVNRYFSPHVALNPTYYLIPNRPIKVDVTDGVTTWTIFRGFVRSYKPQPDKYGQRRAEIRAVDYLSKLQAADIDIPIRENVRSDEVITDILNYAFDADVATGRFDFSGTPSATQYVTINGTTYTFVNSLTSANNVLIGTGTYTARYETIDNLVAAINGWDTADSAYHLSTTRPALVRAARTASWYQVAKDLDVTRFYRFGEPSGATAHDHGTNRKDATYVLAPTLGSTGLITGDSDSSVRLNGSTQYISVPPISFNKRSFSIVFWFNADTLPATQDVFSVFHSFAAGKTFYIRLTSSGTIIVDFYLGGGSVSSTSGNFIAGVPYMVTVTFDYATSTCSIYLDGQTTPIGQGTAGPLTTDESALIQIGAFTSAGTTKFDGFVDEFLLFLDKVLTPAQIDRLYQARMLSPGVTLKSMLKGSIGNAFTMSEVASNVTATGATLSGGGTKPTASMGGSSLQTGVRTFPVVGDDWYSGEVNALTAIQQVVDSENGRFYQKQDGTLVFENGDQRFKDATTAPTITLTVNDEVVALEGEESEDAIRNEVRVNYSPRSTLSTGVVASISGTVPAAGKWGSQSSDPNERKVVNADGGQTVISLQYRDPDTGQPIGAKDLVLPLTASVDWTAFDHPTNADAADYTNGDPVTGIKHVFLGVAPKATGVDIHVKNTALGPLHFRKLQVRGTKITKYDKLSARREDTASIERYGRRVLTYNLPIPVDSNFAYAMAEYLLGRLKDPFYEVKGLKVENRLTIGGVPVFSVPIGAIIKPYEYQTIDSANVPKVRVCGYSYDTSTEGEFSVTWDIERVDNLTFGIYNDSANGKYDECYYGV